METKEHKQMDRTRSEGDCIMQLTLDQKPAPERMVRPDCWDSKKCNKAWYNKPFRFMQDRKCPVADGEKPMLLNCPLKILMDAIAEGDRKEMDENKEFPIGTPERTYAELLDREHLYV